MDTIDKYMVVLLSAILIGVSLVLIVVGNRLTRINVEAQLDELRTRIEALECPEPKDNPPEPPLAP